MPLPFSAEIWPVLVMPPEAVLPNCATLLREMASFCAEEIVPALVMPPAKIDTPNDALLSPTKMASL